MNIQFLFSCIPRTKPSSPPSLPPSLHSTLCSFLFPFSNLRFPPAVSPPAPSVYPNSPPLPQPSPSSSLPPTSTRFILIFFFFFLNVTTSSTLSDLLAGSPHSSVSTVFRLKKNSSYECSCAYIHLDQAEGAPAVCRYRQVSSESQWHTGRLVRESVC